MATKKKAQVVDETPVTAPLFVKHHYLVIESHDGVEFYIDRNAALTSRVIAAALKELGNRADEEVDDLSDDIQAAQQAHQQGGGGGGSSTAAASSSFFIMGGDIEVKCNGEKAANASAQLPIVYPSTLVVASMAQQRPATGDINLGRSGQGGGMGGTSGGGGGSSKNVNSKQAQQLLAQQELLAQQLMQYQQVDAALSAMADLPLTHLRLVHINAPMLELAVRFMHYKYRNDQITEADQRQGFFGFISGKSYPPPPPGASSAFGAFGGSASGVFGGGSPFGASPPTAGSPSKHRKSVAAAAAAAAAASGPAVDSVTGGGIAQMPPVGSQRHMELLSVSLLLQL